MARASKLTPAVQARIAEAIRKGATYELAAAYGGIHYDTFRVWMETKPAFSEAIKGAEAEAAAGWLDIIEQAAPTDWKAAAWKLERRYPAMYGRTVQQQEHSGQVQVRVQHGIDPDDAELAALALAYAARVADRHGSQLAGGVRGAGERDALSTAGPSTPAQ